MEAIFVTKFRFFGKRIEIVRDKEELEHDSRTANKTRLGLYEEMTIKSVGTTIIAMKILRSSG